MRRITVNLLPVKLLVVLMVLGGNYLCLPQTHPDLLKNTYTISNLENNLVRDYSWVPFPKYSERAAWNKISPQIKEQIKEKAEPSIGYTWKTIPAASYLDYVRTGNRSKFEKLRREEMQRLERLVLAELIAGNGKYLNTIVDGVWAACEQSSWVLSAHLSPQKAGEGLPDVEDPIVDLGSADMACLLAWIDYFLHDEFNRINPLISRRIKYEIQVRVLQPYLKRDDFWWMGFKKNPVNNWNTYINHRVLACLLLEEDSLAVKINGVHKVMASLDAFVNSYSVDGGCDEGPNYWSMAGGELFESLDLMCAATNGGSSIFGDEKIKNILAFIYRARVAGDYYINFADASARVHPDFQVLYRAGKRMQDSNLVNLAYMVRAKEIKNLHVKDDGLESMLHEIFLGAVAKDIGEVNLPIRYWFPSIGLAIARDKENSAKGYFLAVKAGNNGESHNHNDVGSCIVFYDGRPVLVDAGVGTYTRKTFGKDRYTLWNTQSDYHNAPTINGKMQQGGTEFAAKEITYQDDGIVMNFSQDIASAYPADAAVTSWKRRYTYIRGSSIKITDNFQLAEKKGDSYLNFLTCCIVNEYKPGMIQLKSGNESLYINFDPSVVTFSSEQVSFDDARLSGSWGAGLYRIRFKVISKTLIDSIQILLHK